MYLVEIKCSMQDVGVKCIMQDVIVEDMSDIMSGPFISKKRKSHVACRILL